MSSGKKEESNKEVHKGRIAFGFPELAAILSTLGGFTLVFIIYNLEQQNEYIRHVDNRIHTMDNQREEIKQLKKKIASYEAVLFPGRKMQNEW